MVKVPETKEFYDFGTFRLEVKRHRLWRGEELVSLTPKEFELLLILVENAGRVMEKDDLHEMIWKDTFVEDGTLTRNISWLRKKLGAGNQGGENFIETCPKRGYRFLPEVTKSFAPNALVVEEQMLTRILVEETITLDAETPGHGDGGRKIAALPSVAPSPRHRVTVSLSLAGIAIAAIGFAVFQNFFRQSESSTVTVNRVVPFSGLPGREDSPAFSPDGRQIAFSWNGGEAETFDVYVKIVGAGEPVRLTKNEADDLNPTFSPDGSHIAFVRTFPSHSELFLIPALGGAERKICDLRPTRSYVSFSPDGRTLAMEDVDTDRIEAGVFLVDVANGKKRRLTTPPEHSADDRPRFAPDGNSVVFIRSTGSVVQDLFVVSPEGGEPRQLTFDKTWINGAAWTVDGKKIVFASMRGSNSRTNLWQITATGDEPEMIATGGKNLGNPAAAPDGRTIAFVEEALDMNIWRFGSEPPAVAGGLTPASRNANSKPSTPNLPPGGYNFKKFIASSRNDNSPQISPDGKRVVFASDRTANYEIWIADADGSNAMQLTDLQNSPTGSPRFSPDGQFVVFDAQIEGNGDIFVVPAGGGPIRRLTDADSFDFMPGWSADGGSIYFASNRGGDDQIWKIPISGGEPVQITKQGGRESWESADGAELYFSKSKGVTGLWRIVAADGEEAAVPELAEAGHWRSWSMTPDGIFFVARSAHPPYVVKFFDLKSGQLSEAATAENAPVWVFPSLSVSGDRKTILYAQYDQIGSSIMLAEFGR